MENITKAYLEEEVEFLKREIHLEKVKREVRKQNDRLIGFINVLLTAILFIFLI